MGYVALGCLSRWNAAGGVPWDPKNHLEQLPRFSTRRGRRRLRICPPNVSFALREPGWAANSACIEASAELMREWLPEALRGLSVGMAHLGVRIGSPCLWENAR